MVRESRSCFRKPSRHHHAGKSRLLDLYVWLDRQTQRRGDGAPRVGESDRLANESITDRRRRKDAAIHVAEFRRLISGIVFYVVLGRHARVDLGGVAPQPEGSVELYCARKHHAHFSSVRRTATTRGS